MRVKLAQPQYCWLNLERNAMSACTNCGNGLERRRCLTCAAEAAKAQPHSRSVGGFRLLGAGLGGVALAGLLIAGIASASSATPEDALKQASAATFAAGTSTFTLDGVIKVSGSFGGKNLRIRGKGLNDFTPHQSSLTAKGAGVYVDEVLSDNTLYFRTSPQGEWTSVDMKKVSGLSSITGPGSFTPQGVTSNQAAWAHAVKAGSTTVNGHACTTYEIPVPSSTLLSALSKELGSSGSGLASAMGKALLKDIHVSDTIAVDNASQVMREVRVNVSLSLLGQTLSEKINMVLDNFGEPVKIEVPKSATPAENLPSLLS